MKTKMKQVFQELAEYIEFPTVIYVYETNRILAVNGYAGEIIGKEHKGIKDLLGERVNRKYSPAILNNGSTVFYNREILAQGKKILVDIEVNSLLLDDSHIIITFFEKSYKQCFAKYMKSPLPRIFWKDKDAMYLGANEPFRRDLELGEINGQHYENKQILANTELSEKIGEDESVIFKSKNGLYDIIQTINVSEENAFFAKIHRIPLINKNGTVVGIIGVYQVILNREEYRNLYSDTENEVNLLNELVNFSDTVLISFWEKEGWPIKSISQNISNYGYSCEDFLSGKLKWQDIVLEDDYERISRELAEADKDYGETLIQEYRIVKANKEIVWVRDETIVVAKNKKVHYREGMLHDITLEKNLEIELGKTREQQKKVILKEKAQKNKAPVYVKKLETILNEINAYIYVLEREDKRILYVNDRVTNEYGDDVIGRTIGALWSMKEIEPFPIVGEAIGDEQHEISEFYDHLKKRYYMATYQAVEWVDKQPAIILNMVDITRLIHLKNNIEVQADKDFLTGLPNKLRFETDICYYVRQAIEYNKSGYIFLIDLDDFKHINDGLGYDYGDGLLKIIAHYLIHLPYIDGHCYRFGGDEFVIILDSAYEGRLDYIVKTIYSRFKKPWFLMGSEYYCTMSMGTVEFPRHGNDASDLLKKAEVAMYEAKKNGKQKIEHYKEGFEISWRGRLDVEKYLRKAVDKGCLEFEVYYQPIIDSRDRKISGAEALLRWKSTELGMINPGEFIPLTEYLGLIVPLGEFVCKEAFTICKRYNKEKDKDFKMHINLSVVQLVQPNIVDRIMEIVRTADVNPQNIVFEVTESLAIEDMVLMKQVISQLRENGFQIAIDDFGTGYASLNHMAEMQLDYVKIDKSFIESYGTSKFSPGLLSSITELAHSIYAEIIVEGVETKQQLEFLMFLSADKYQGYYFGRPMPEEDFVRYMEKSYGKNTWN